MTGPGARTDISAVDAGARETSAIGLDGGEIVAIGVDVGGSKILTIALGAGHQILAERIRPTPPPAEFLAAIVSEIAAITSGEMAEIPVGVGAAGLVDRDGCLHFVPHSRGLEGTSLRDRLREATGRPVFVENDATAAAWAEVRLGAARGVADVLVVTLGTGIGAGIVADGRLVRGGHGFAGDVGHMVVERDGPPCPCGGRGHWEVIASGQALDRLARQHGWFSGRRLALAAAATGDPAATGATVAAATGDPAATAATNAEAATASAGAVSRTPAQDVIAEYAGSVALGLGSLVNVLDPSVVVVGGGVGALGEALLVPLRIAMAREIQASAAAGGPGRPEPTLVAARLGARAGAIGAALLAAEAMEGT